jgi:hypothetical protein
MTWQDLMACICAFFGLSIIALVLGLVSHAEARKQGLKMHAAGMVGLIFGALGTAGWTLFWGIILIGATAAGTHTTSMPATPAATETTGTVGQQIASWYTAGGKAKMDAVNTDLRGISQAATTSDWAGLQTTCTQLTVDTATAASYTPIPDTGVQDAYQQALAYFNKSGNECVTGALSHNADLLTQAGADTRTGTSFIQQATARINAANGR